MIKKRYLLGLFIFVLLFPASVFAESPAETSTQGDVITQNETEGYYCEDENTDPNAIVPLSTCTGNGGVARINVLAGTALTWNVDPKFSTVYTFYGQIIVQNSQTGTVEDIIPISCIGAFGGMCGGEVVPDVAYTGIAYIASISGRADDASGLGYWTVPPCSIPFLSW